MYDNLFYALNEYIPKGKPVELMRYAESMMEICISSKEYENIREYSYLSRETDSNRDLNEVG